jgi:hypothetical protein
LKNAPFVTAFAGDGDSGGIANVLATACACNALAGDCGGIANTFPLVALDGAKLQLKAVNRKRTKP